MNQRNLARLVGKTASITLVASTVSGLAILLGEVIAARLHRYARPDMRLAMRTTVGETTAPPLRLVLLGDSSALGVGVDRVSDTVGGHLAELLSHAAPARRIELTSVAVARSKSADLDTQVSRALLGERPDIAVILVGANDATALRPAGRAADHLADAVIRLREAGVQVVVGSCPDLGAMRAFAQPWRQIAGWLGDRMARRQLSATVHAGGIPVDLAARTGQVFRADAGTLCHDGFHPSADGYRVWAHALLPAVTEAASAAHRS